MVYFSAPFAENRINEDVIKIELVGGGRRLERKMRRGEGKKTRQEKIRINRKGKRKTFLNGSLLNGHDFS